MKKEKEWTKEEIEEFEKRVEKDVGFVTIEEDGNYNIMTFDNDEDEEIIEEEMSLSDFQNKQLVIKINAKYYALNEIDKHAS